MVVGEPTLMGGEFGDEDERLITRLENQQYEPTGADEENKFPNSPSVQHNSPWGADKKPSIPTSGPPAAAGTQGGEEKTEWPCRASENGIVGMLWWRWTGAKVYMSRDIRKHTIWCVPKKDLNQPVHPRSLISHHCQHEEILHPWLSRMHSVKILIRLHKCAGWSQSLLDAHVWRLYSGSLIWLFVGGTSEGTFSDVKAHIFAHGRWRMIVH